MSFGYRSGEVLPSSAPDSLTPTTTAAVIQVDVSVSSPTCHRIGDPPFSFTLSATYIYNGPTRFKRYKCDTVYDVHYALFRPIVHLRDLETGQLIPRSRIDVCQVRIAPDGSEDVGSAHFLTLKPNITQHVNIILNSSPTWEEQLANAERPLNGLANGQLLQVEVTGGLMARWWKVEKIYEGTRTANQQNKIESQHVGDVPLLHNSDDWSSPIVLQFMTTEPAQFRIEW